MIEWKWEMNQKPVDGEVNDNKYFSKIDATGAEVTFEQRSAPPETRLYKKEMGHSVFIQLVFTV